MSMNVIIGLGNMSKANISTGVQVINKQTCLKRRIILIRRCSSSYRRELKVATLKRAREPSSGVESRANGTVEPGLPLEDPLSRKRLYTGQYDKQTDSTISNIPKKTK